eukprot:g8845.t1
MKKRFGKKGGASMGGGGRSPRLTDPGPGLAASGGGYDPNVAPLPSEQEVNAMFLEVMESHGVTKMEQQDALKHLTAEQKWETVITERAKAKGGGSRRGSTGGIPAPGGRVSSRSVLPDIGAESTAVDYAEQLLAPGMPPLDEIKDLKLTLRAASKNWLVEFYEAGGLTALVMNLSDVEVIEDKTDKDVQLQVELLKCLKASLNNQLGIDFLAARPEVVGILALNFGSEDVFICTQALELLAVLMVDGPEGYRAVLAAMDYFKLVKGERVRFYSLLDALMTDEADLAFKRDVMLFINTLVNSAMDIEERIEIRADLIYTGILDAVERLKNQSVDVFMEQGDEALSDDRIELDNQLHVFEAVVNKDIAEVQHTYSDEQTVNLSDPEQLYSTICSSVVEYDCFGVFLSIMQHLLVIPSADLAGKQQWEAAEEAIHQIVTHSDDHFSLTYEDLKKMLDWKDRLEELSVKCKTLEW